MSYDHEGKGSPEEVSHLLRTLIEVELSQRELLTRMSAKLDTTLCILEHISKNTCETLNEVHEQKELLAVSIECKELCAPPQARALPRASHHEPQDCCEKVKRKPYCAYEPCELREEGGGSAESQLGSASPQHVFGAPFPPAVLTDGPAERANEGPARRVPRGPFRGFMTPGKDIKPLGIKAAAGLGGNSDPVVFGKYTVYGQDATSKDTEAADISGAESGSVVLATANHYISYSTDAGTSFTSLDPTTIFDNTADGGLCCDQIVQYVPSIDRFIWLMQFSVGTDGKNRLRIAAASPETVSSSKCTSWTYWDLTSDALGITTTTTDAKNKIHFLDYPNMSIGNNFLYISVNNFTKDVGDPPTGGRIIVRVPLSDIQAAGTINYGYTNWADSALAYDGHVTQNTGDEAYWAGNDNNSTMRVFNWNESSTSYFWRDVGVNNWPNDRKLSSITKDNNTDWLAAANGFPAFGVIGATRRGNEIWFAWTASNGPGADGGFNFPNAHIQVVKLDPTNNYKLLDQFAIWNNDHAFAYPALATNDRGEVGITLGWGGNTFYANSAVGILGDFMVWYPELSDTSITRWGDFVTARQASPQTGLFAGFGYVVLKDSTEVGYRFEPFYILFGRNSLINPG